MIASAHTDLRDQQAERKEGDVRFELDAADLDHLHTALSGASRHFASKPALPRSDLASDDMANVLTAEQLVDHFDRAGQRICHTARAHQLIVGGPPLRLEITISLCSGGQRYLDERWATTRNSGDSIVAGSLP